MLNSESHVHYKIKTSGAKESFFPVGQVSSIPSTDNALKYKDLSYQTISCIIKDNKIKHLITLWNESYHVTFGFKLRLLKK